MLPEGFIDSEEFPLRFLFPLQVFCQREGDRVCLNLIKNFANAGKLYCSAEAYERARTNGGVVSMTDAAGRTIRIVAPECQVLRFPIEENALEDYLALR